MDEAELVKRLERLEWENRLFRRMGLAVLGAVGAVLLMGFARPSRTVTANKFVLLDSQGRARITISTPRYAGATFGMRPDEPAIWVSDAKGDDRAILTPDALRFASRDGRPLATFAAGGQDGPVLRFFGGKREKFGAFTSQVRLMTLDGTGLSINRQDGRPIIHLGGVDFEAMAVPRKAATRALPEARPELTLYGDGGSVDLGAMHLIGPYVALTYGKLPTPPSVSRSGHLRRWVGTFMRAVEPLVWMSAKDGVPELTVGRPGGFQTVIGGTSLVTPATGETHQTSAASIVMFGNDKKHHVIWEAPQQ